MCNTVCHLIYSYEIYINKVTHINLCDMHIKHTMQKTKSLTSDRLEQGSKDRRGYECHGRYVAISLL